MTTQADILRASFAGNPGNCQLASFEAVDLRGADALSFAQAQLAGDLRPLALAHWQWNSWLNSQGRVIALLLLLRPGPDHLRILLPGLRAQALAQQLRRFVFRSKLMIECPQLSIYGTFSAPAAPLACGGESEVTADGDTSIRLGGCLGRSLRIGSAANGAGSLAAWHAADIVDGIPWLTAAAVEAWIPQALGLERLAAFSTAKGCYPGQEIVARTHFLGRSKRQLLHATLAGPLLPEPGARLFASPDLAAAAVAEVVASAPAGDQVLALVVARENAPATVYHGESRTPVVLHPAG